MSKVKVKSHKQLDHLSPSSIDSWLRCPKQFEFSKIDKIVMPPSFAMITGTTTHAGIEHNLKYKIKKGKLAPLASVKEAASKAFNREVSKHSRLKKDKAKGAFKDQGIAMTTYHYEHISAKIKPLQVEQRYELKDFMEGFGLVGYIDLLEKKGKYKQITDNKTSGRRYADLKVHIHNQLTAYIYMYQKITKKKISRAGIVVLLNQKTVGAQQIDTVVSKERIDMWLDTCFYVARNINAGNFPRRNDALTSACNWCGYRKLCIPFTTQFSVK